MADRKDLPPPTSANFETRVRETVMTYLGRMGDPLDRGVTLRDLLDSGLAKLRSGRSTSNLGSGSLPIIPGQTSGGTGTAYEPDLTPPPTPTGFVVSAAISHVFIEHDAPTYSQGNGHLRTRVYGKVVAAGDPLPVFADAVEVAQFSGTVFALPSNPATTWRLWIKWETRDGIVSPGPAGGTNGLAVTTGQDVSKLLEALAGEITSSELSQSLIDQIESGNEGLTTAVELLQGRFTVKTDAAGHVSGFGLASTANDATPFSEFGVRADRFWIAPPSFSSATAPTTGLYKGYVWRDTGVNPAVTRYWDGAAWTTAPQNLPFVVAASPTTINGATVPAGVYIDTAMIADATITNAKIGNAAIDDAKIANLSASKITAGSMQVGSYIQSSNYVFNTAGWKINSDGTADFANVLFRGAMYGGSAAGYSSGTGFFSGEATTQTVNGDPSYNNVSLLLHGEGADGGLVFTDNSPSPKTPTVVGQVITTNAKARYGDTSIYPLGNSLGFGYTSRGLTFLLTATVYGGDQIWYNQWAFPSDGSSSQTYNWNLGVGSSADGRDPTYVPNGSNSYFVQPVTPNNNAGGIFTLGSNVSSIPNFIRQMHFAAKSWTIEVWMQWSGTLSSNVAPLFDSGTSDQGGSDMSRGVIFGDLGNLVNPSQKLRLRVKQSAGGADALNKSTDANIPINQVNMLAVSYNANGSSFFYMNGGYAPSGGQNTWTATLDNPSNALSLGLPRLLTRGDTYFAAPLGTRIYLLRVYDTNLTKQELDSNWVSGIALNGGAASGVVIPSYLQYASSATFALGTASFTVEAWLYCDNHHGLVAASPGATNGVFWGVSNGRLVAAYGSTTSQSGVLTASTTHPINTWFHAALVVKNSTANLYQNGSHVGSLAWPGVNTDATCELFVGGASQTDITFNSITALFGFKGYIDDFRFTKGVARYDGVFIPPLAAHPDSAGDGSSPAPGYLWRVGDPTGARIQWTGTNVEIYGSNNQLSLTTGSLLNISQISGLGALAASDNVNVEQVTGLGGLATQNTVSSGQVTGLGGLATVNQINDGNISTYIAAGAIGNAYIGNFISSANFNGVINSSGNITNFGSAGWAIGKAGNAVFNDVKLRGELNGGSFTGFAWPAAGSADGFHLGPSGLLLGNYNTILPSGNRRYLQINSNGNLYAPGFSVVDGDATFSGTVSANVIKTNSIEGGAVSSGYSSSSAGTTTSITVTIPSGSSSLSVMAYLGPPYIAIANPGTKDAYPYTEVIVGTLVVNGVTMTTQKGVLIWSTGSPSAGTYSVSLSRDNASGVMTLSVQVSKR